ncbi:MAG TPA: carbon-nitrogen hydrolase family protein [Thermomicrobiales bacterium]|nr:carbon-nitrogen hydrolase family protein [Thermomicrobiales bacterium]
MDVGRTDASSLLRIGLAAARNAPSMEERLQTVDRFLDKAGEREVAIVCFPETYLPGLRGMDFLVPPHDQMLQQTALERVRAAALRNRVAVIMGMEWATPVGLHNVAFVISREGAVEGYQAKNQIPPEEEPFYVPDGRRRLFEIDGIPFGITICHEGWRYPEAVRWSAVRGARLVFHPQVTGSDQSGVTITRWGDPDSPYYEKAMVARSVENTVYFASVNNAMRYQDSATSLLDPDGRCLAHVPYGEEHLLVHDIDVSRATGFCARRYNPAFYPTA